MNALMTAFSRLCGATIDTVELNAKVVPDCETLHHSGWAQDQYRFALQAAYSARALPGALPVQRLKACENAPTSP
jgi:hypothetical protein